MRRGRATGLVIAAVLSAAAGACSQPPQEPLQLERNRITVYNNTPDEWQNAEIWLNHYFRMPVRSIAANGSFQVSLDQFVDAYGRRFDYGRLQITDVRLKAKRANGEPVELVMPFKKDGLSDALEGMKK
jgi:hypothetical protein